MTSEQVGQPVPQITEETIAAARLRLVIDEKLGRVTPDHIRRISAMNRVDALVENFRALISAGDLDRFARQLSLSPSDINDVVDSLQGEREIDRSGMVQFIADLLESGALDRWQIDDQVRTTLRWLRESTQSILTNEGVSEQSSESEQGRSSSSK